MDDWLEFAGSGSVSGDKTKLITNSGDGTFEVPSGDVKNEEGKTFVRKGTISSNVSFPKDIDRSNFDPAVMRDTYCIGLLMFRCSDDKLIGACIGAWDCG